MSTEVTEQKYECPRCGHCSKQRYGMFKHVYRKNPCKPIKSDISLEEYRKTLEKELAAYAREQMRLKAKKKQGNSEKTDRDLEELRREVYDLKRVVIEILLRNRFPQGTPPEKEDKEHGEQ